MFGNEGCPKRASIQSLSDEENDDNSDVSSYKGEHSGALVLSDNVNKEQPSFGNIAVTNSSDVHFGNKTYYQGPVTIKQFLYANPHLADSNEYSEQVLSGHEAENDGQTNTGFVCDSNENKTVINCDKDNKNDVNLDTHSGVQKGTQWLQNFSRQHLIVIITLAIVLLFSLITLLAVLLTKHPPISAGLQGFPFDSNEQEKSTPIDGPLDPNVNLTLSGKLKIVSRLEWVAQPPVEKATPLKLPVPYVIIWHTATENCSDQAACTFHVRFIQTFHIESRHWWDIGYNFLVGGDGFAYEGRGWKSEGAHTYGYNSRSIGIAFIGTFIQVKPPDRQIIAAKQLVEKGVAMGYIAQNYKVLAARQLSTTQSPGAVLYEDIKTWSHWSPNP